VEPILSALGLFKQLGARTLFDGVDLTVTADERLALVGVNGAGKSTLLRILVGDPHETYDGGTLARRRGLRIGYVAQEPALDPDLTVQETLRTATRSRQEVLAGIAEVESMLASNTLQGSALTQALAQQAALHERIDALGGWDIDHEIRGLCASLQVPSPERVIATLSIGERRRVALACALLDRPDLLALDEPTNHLDAATTTWLEERLRRWPGALLLVTHDRYFLDRVATRIVEVDRAKLYSYPGNYSAYLGARAQRLASEAQAERDRLSFIRRELDWVRRSPAARSTKQQARLDRFDDAVENRPDGISPDARSLALRIPTGPRLGKTVLEAHGLTKSLGGKILFSNLDLLMKPGDRIGIVGPNGMGKTTLIRTLLGQLEPDGGRVVMGINTKPLFLDQTRSDLKDDQTVLEAVAADDDKVFLPSGPVHVRTFLRMMLLDDRVCGAKIGDLSGGERNRVQLAKLLKEGSNFLVLDEPTNDLDLMTLSALEEALVDFPGCALVVSHDRWFLDRVATAILAFEGEGKLVLHAGNYSEYLARRDDDNTSIETSAIKNAAKKAESASAPKSKKLTLGERKELDGIEGTIAAAEEKVAAIEAALADPDLYVSRRDEAAKMQDALAVAKAEVERLLERWAFLSEKAEQG
jgi:ATP-binding cassette subfamily F protein uup